MALKGRVVERSVCSCYVKEQAVFLSFSFFLSIVIPVYINCPPPPLWESIQANRGRKLHFPLQIREAAQFQGQIHCASLSLFIFLPRKTFRLSANVSSNDSTCHAISQTNRRLVHEHFVNVHMAAFFTRHRLTVAGDNERLFGFFICFFFPLLLLCRFFFQQQNCYIKCA